MNALSRLITRVTKRQFQIARNVDEISTVLDRTIAFASAETPYISEAEVEEIAATIPNVAPADEEVVTEENVEDAAV